MLLEIVSEREERMDGGTGKIEKVNEMLWGPPCGDGGYVCVSETGGGDVYREV
jgi:hypothetical protein